MRPALPMLSFRDPEAFADWLADHHGSSPGVWLKLAKKGSGVPSVTYAEAIEIALSWGWIDGQKQAHDGLHWLQKFTPRGARSLWSKINRDNATALIAATSLKGSRRSGSFASTNCLTAGVPCTRGAHRRFARAGCSRPAMERIISTRWFESTYRNQESEPVSAYLQRARISGFVSCGVLHRMFCSSASRPNLYVRSGCNWRSRVRRLT